MSPRLTQVAVIGAAEGDPEALEAAEEVGRRLAEAGAVVVCGGRGGVMEAAARGASRAGGIAIGVLPGSDPGEANEHIAHVVATGVGHARNLAVVGSGEAVIAVDGHWGTLSEIAFARRLGRPVVALRSWELRHHAGEDLGIVEAAGAAEAVTIALDAVSRR
ncbi:MAG: TIGR00725 family protein [Solirubrobacterales bacterium]